MIRLGEPNAMNQGVHVHVLVYATLMLLPFHNVDRFLQYVLFQFTCFYLYFIFVVNVVVICNHLIVTFLHSIAQACHYTI